MNFSHFFQKILLFLKSIPSITWLILAWIFILSLQMPIFFMHNHSAYDLNPYPDAVIYAAGAKNLSQGLGYNLSYLGENIKISLPPLYIAFLSLFAFFINSKIYFVAANIFLQLTTVFILYLILKKKTKPKNWFLLPLGLALYVSHSVIFWLVQVAMMENLGLFLIMFTLFVFTNLKRNSRKQIILLFFSAISFIFTKYSYFPIGFALIIIVINKLYQKKAWSAIILFFLLFVLGFICCFLVSSMSFNQIILFIKQLLFENNRQGIAFSFANVLPHLHTTAEIFGGAPIKFISSGLKMCSPFITYFYLISLALSFYYRFQREINTYFSFLILIQLPLPILFYDYHARYVLLIVPIMIVAIFYNWQLLQKILKGVRSFFIWLLLILGLSLQLYTQTPLFVSIIRENLLNQSTSFSHLQIISGNRFLNQNPQAYLISAFPPYLFNYFDNNQYSFQILPISNFQHFLDGKTKVWGPNIDPKRLAEMNFTDYYQELINEGHQLYVISSNNFEYQYLYLTLLRNHFQLKASSFPCDGDCTIYHLESKTELSSTEIS